MDENKRNDKDNLYYSVLLNAWIITSLELDKSILFLSSAGIGLLVTILLSFNVASLFIFTLIIFACMLFVVCIIGVLLILSLNKKHLENIRNKNNSLSKHLSRLDRFVYYAYALGIIITLVVGIVVGWSNLNKTLEEEMNRNEFPQESANVKEEKSFSGFETMKPDFDDSTTVQQTETLGPATQSDNESQNTNE